MSTEARFSENCNIKYEIEQSDISALVRIAFTNNLKKDFTVKQMVNHLNNACSEYFSEDTIRKHMNKQCYLSWLDKKYVIIKSIDRHLKEDGIKTRSYTYTCVYRTKEQK